MTKHLQISEKGLSPRRERERRALRARTISSVQEHVGECAIPGMQGGQAWPMVPRAFSLPFKEIVMSPVHFDCCCCSSDKVGQYQLKLIYNDKSIRQRGISWLMYLPEFDTPGEF